MILKNCLIVYNNDLVVRDLKIKGDKIIKISEHLTEEDDLIIDVEENLVSPGFIDMHVHLREPGYEHKETIKTGSRAAAAGGYTYICAMPNTKPIIDNLDLVMDFYERVKKDAIVKVKTYAAITKKFSNEDELVDMQALSTFVCGFTNDGVGIQSAHTMYQAMKESYLNECLISAHCEEESLLYNGYVHAGVKSEQEGWKGIHSLTESLQVARDVLISEATKCRYHVCHISTKESVEQVRLAKKRGAYVSAEVTPHHLLLTDAEVVDSNYKMNPPVRGLDDKYALINGLLDGTIEVIATDHAPHTKNEKESGLAKAPFGIVGLETAFPLIYTYFVKTGLATIQQAIEWFSVNPARILNLKYGHIHEGRIADLTVIDIKNSRRIDAEKFYSKGKNTPFNNRECYGFPIMTLVDGKIVYDAKNSYMEGLDE